VPTNSCYSLVQSAYASAYWTLLNKRSDVQDKHKCSASFLIAATPAIRDKSLRDAPWTTRILFVFHLLTTAKAQTLTNHHRARTIVDLFLDRSTDDCAGGGSTFKARNHNYAYIWASQLAYRSTFATPGRRSGRTRGELLYQAGKKRHTNAPMPKDNDATLPGL